MVIMYEVVNRASNHLFSESILFFRNKILKNSFFIYFQFFKIYL